MALFEEIVRDLIDDTYDNYYAIFRRLYSMGMEIIIKTLMNPLVDGYKLFADKWR